MVAIITTTGYVTSDFNLPYMAQAILIALMLIGGCSVFSGSSGREDPGSVEQGAVEIG